MLNRQSQYGLTLVELMIGVAIVSMLLIAAAPSFTLWIQSTQNRSAAESILNGLQLARAEAVRRNTMVRFTLTDASGLVAWNVGCVTVTDNCPATIQKRSASEGTVNARAGISTDAIPNPAPANQFSTEISAGTGLGAGVSFDSMGRVPMANVGTDITRIDITNAAMSSARRMVVVVGTGGQIRMCDPSIALSVNPQGCS